MRHAVNFLPATLVDLRAGRGASEDGAFNLKALQARAAWNAFQPQLYVAVAVVALVIAGAWGAKLVPPSGADVQLSRR
jgi:hypothetical protein